MTESNSSTVEVLDVRQARHIARANVACTMGHLEGRGGMTPEQQAEALQASIDHLDAAKAALIAAQELATTRDFDAHQTAKAEARSEGFSSVAEKALVEKTASDAEAFANSNPAPADEGEVKEGTEEV